MSKPGRADSNSANLTPASGRQDHTTSPYAATSLVRSLGDRSQAFRQPALQPCRAQNAAAPTASRPYVRDDGQRPSDGTGWRKEATDLGSRSTAADRGRLARRAKQSPAMSRHRCRRWRRSNHDGHLRCQVIRRAGASRHRRPFRITWTIPPTTCRSSTRGTPRVRGKKGSRRLS